MNLIFNEISLLPLLDNEHALKDHFIALIKTFEEAKKKHGFKHLVFPTNIGEINVTADKTFLQWVYSIANQSQKNTILSVVKRPFGNEILADEVNALDRYYYINEEAGIKETYCNGLAVAYVRKMLCASLATQSFWTENVIKFHEIINNDLETTTVSAFNLSNPKHLEVDTISSFIENLGEVTLIETDVSPNQKPIALRDDHGNDVLRAFANRLVNSNYVLSVINSLPFNPKAINLIRRVYPDGRIEMVLHWDDRGLGLVIQTTGRNLRETCEISLKLKEQFDK